MDLFDHSFVDLWKQLNQHSVKYILVGGFATNLHGYQRYTGDMDLYIEDTIDNRKKLRLAYKDYSNIDFEGFERIQFVPGWIDFPLNNGVRLDIMTTMVGIDDSFDDCLRKAKVCEVEGINVPVLHINHLIENKKKVGRPKDQLDIIYLEKIKQLREEEEIPSPDA